MSECGKEICRVLCVRKTASADGAIGSRGLYHGSCWATGVFLARLYPVRQKSIAPDTYLFIQRRYLPGLQTTLGTGRRCP